MITLVCHIFMDEDVADSIHQDIAFSLDVSDILMMDDSVSIDDLNMFIYCYSGLSYYYYICFCFVSMLVRTRPFLSDQTA